MMKHKPRKQLRLLSTSPPIRKPKTTLWKKEKVHPPPAEINCGADNSGSEVHKNILAASRELKGFAGYQNQS